MNYFKAAEQVLSSVSALKKALENLETRKARLIASGAPREPGAIDYTKPFTNSHYVSDTLNELLELSECTQNIANTKNELDYISGIIEQLSDDYKQIITMWYIEGKTKEHIAQAMYIESPTTVYNLRNKAVAEFALLYYGAAALNSI